MTIRAVLPPSRVPGGSLQRSDGGEQSSARHRATATLRSFETPVRGHAFAAAPTGGSAPEAGGRARLTREPSNPADPLAVAVWVEATDDRPWRIGYLDRGVAARVAPRLDAGLRVDARVEGWVPEPEGRWHRPLIRLVPDTASGSAPPQPGSGDGSARRGMGSPTPAGPKTRPSATGVAVGGQEAPEPLWQRPPGVTRRRLRRD